MDNKDYSQESTIDMAYEIIKEEKQPVEFYDLWNRIVELKGYNEEQIDENESVFYTNITLDGRVINVGDNRWDLRERHKFEDVNIDMNDVYSDDDSAEEDDVDDSSIEDSYSDD
jgi:DNA-directed RNA polymerase subunit delta